MPHDTSSNSLFGRMSTRSSFMSHKDIKVTIQLLNDTDSISNEFKRSLPAQAIVDYICEVKQIKDRDFLGLRFQDHLKHRYWVDLSRPISHILKTFKVDSLNLRLRFRYYPVDPAGLRDINTRYQLFVQLQRDLIHGRLYCPQQKSAELAGLILQAQLGDYSDEKCPGNYVSQYNILLRQSPPLELRITECHKSFAGLSTEQAETEFVRRAGEIETYGFDPYVVKDTKDGKDVYIGVNYHGVIIFKSNHRIHNIPWNQLAKVDFTGKEIRIFTSESYALPTQAAEGGEETQRDKKGRILLKYLCPNLYFAKHLWNHILSQQAFFTEQSALMIKPKFSKPRIPLLSRGSTFRFPSQRVLKEIDTAELQNGTVTTTEQNPEEHTFIRYELERHEPRAEQPWLSHSNYTTLPSNFKMNFSKKNDNDNELHSPEAENRDRSGTQHSFELNETPALLSPAMSEGSPCTPLLDSPSTSSCHDENVVTFSVHLVKYERSPQNSPEPEESKSNGSVETEEIDGPLHCSTPLFNRYPQSEKPANGNGHVITSNGSAASSTASVPQRSLASRITSSIFVTLLMVLLLVALCITVFERHEGPDWIESYPFLSNVRHSYYEPARHITLQYYNKFVR